MHQLCVMKGDRLAVSPARHTLSDRRINSSHGNNIFIFQGQKIVLFPSRCQSAVDTFGVAMLFALAAAEMTGTQSASKPTRERMLVVNWWAIVNSFRKNKKKRSGAQSWAGCRCQAANIWEILNSCISLKNKWKSSSNRWVEHPVRGSVECLVQIIMFSW